MTRTYWSLSLCLSDKYTSLAQLRFSQTKALVVKADVGEREKQMSFAHPSIHILWSFLDTSPYFVLPSLSTHYVC